MPWGALTGIRPTKLAYQELEKRGDFRPLFDAMRVSPEKRRIVEKIVAAQRGVYKKDDANADFFAFVPFCPSKCSYCSFITADINRSGKYIAAFTDALVREIGAAWPLVKNLRSVYVGGGTPVALPVKELERVLKAIGRHDTEYTVEAGRPDCITEENVALLAEYGVNRVCVNRDLQRQNARTPGKHTSRDIVEKYALVKDKFAVNMDLIAGLEGETAADFCYSLSAAVDLRPDNITVHTLCLKRGSALKEEKSYLSENGVSEMVEYAHETLSKAGYEPYYLYRQKYMAGNLENTGYALPGKACVYNVDTMEEISSTVACGANAVSKAVFEGCARIERYKNPKDIPTYRQDREILREKERLSGGRDRVGNRGRKGGAFNRAAPRRLSANS
ncbi:MAG: coproporphyrinogen dehydrogenase HemZ [Eubacteriales bacterium]